MGKKIKNKETNREKSIGGKNKIDIVDILKSISSDTYHKVLCV